MATAPLLTHALGVGRIKVNSTLNEPLSAEIEFTSVTDKELKGLTATLASRAEFDAAGVERLPHLSSIKFTVAKRLDGRYILQLTTEQPVAEPFLHMLLQVEWPGGKLVREYSALIDPPAHFAVQPKGIEPPVVTPAPEQPVAAAPVEPAPLVQPVAPEQAAVPEPAKVEEQVAAVKAEAPAVEEQPKVEPLAPTQPVPAEAAPAPEAVPAPAPVPEAAPAEVAREERLLGPSTEPAAPVVEEIPPGPITPHVVSEAELKEPAPAAGPAPEWANTPEYAVKYGDTLWHIAEGVRSDRQFAVEQVVLAIYRANPDAFFDKNVNNLRAGKILKMPEREAVGEMPVDSARREFRAQYDVWQEYKLKLAAGSRVLTVPEPAPAAQPEVAPPPVKEIRPEPVAKKPEKVEKPAAGKQPDELLKIVRSNLQGEKGTPEKKVAETESAKDAKERQALAERVTTLEESLVSKQLEAKDLSDRIGAVRSQLKRESRLIEIESQQLAQAQQKAQPAPAEPPARPAKPEVKPAEAPKVEAPKAEVPKAEAPAAAKPQEPLAVTKEAPAPAPAPKPKRVTAPTPPPPPAEEKGFLAGLFEAILENELFPALLGAVVLASGAIGFLYYRRRRKAIGEFEESILTSEAIATEGPSSTTSVDTSGQVATAGDTSFLSDFSQGGMGNIHTDEVDPVAEAEVYLAYGRDETAEEILKDAIVKNPDRHELKLKLLEIYHQRSDIKAFETLAEELYAALAGRRDKVWEKVEELGRKLNPDNPMFRGGAAPTKKPEVAAAAPATSLFDTTHADLAAPATAEPSGGIDFDLGAAEPGAPAKAESQAIDFDLDLGVSGKASEAAPEETPFAEKQEGGFEAIDFGQPAASNVVDFDLGAPVAPAGAEPEHAAGGAEGGIDFALDTGAEPAVGAGPAQLSTGGAAPAGQWDETATKLDLAKAYIDMGDAEGARSILDEVMAEGNDEQKRQAKDLAAQIA